MKVSDAVFEKEIRQESTTLRIKHPKRKYKSYQAFGFEANNSPDKNAIETLV